MGRKLKGADARKTASNMGLFQVSVEKMLFVVGRVHLACVHLHAEGKPVDAWASGVRDR